MSLLGSSPMLTPSGIAPAGCACGCHRGGHPTHLRPCCATPGFPDPQDTGTEHAQATPPGSTTPTPSYLPPEPGLLCGACGALVGESMRGAHDEFHSRIPAPLAATPDSHPPISGGPLPYPQKNTGAAEGMYL